MPLVLAVICILIYTSFCLYDRCIGSQDAYLLCMMEAQHKDAGNKRSASRLESRQSQQFGEKYVGARSVGGKAAVNGDTVSYKGQAVVGPGISLVRVLLPQNVWAMRFSGSSEVRDPAWQIRKLRRSAAVVQQMKGKNSEE